KKDGGNYWEEKHISAYNLLVDHPMYYADTLNEAPANGTVICADRMHIDYINRFYPSVKRCFFLPTAGTDTGDFEEQIIFSERPIDFLMIGNYKYIDLPKDMDTDQIFRLLQKQPERTMEEAAEIVYKKNHSDKADSIKELKKYIEKYRFTAVTITALYRERLLRMLLQHGYHIEVYGDGWQNSSCFSEKGFHLHPPVSVTEGLQLMSQAKFVLNNMAWFKDGGSERIYNAMLQGALVLTDRSRYLEKDYDDYSVIWYELNDMEAVLPKIHNLLVSQDAKPDEMRKKAYEITYQKNRWINRAKDFLKYIHRIQKR
nr:glycosyltransferase [Lachnospiraceae bacterium]